MLRRRAVRTEGVSLINWRREVFAFYLGSSLRLVTTRPIVLEEDRSNDSYSYASTRGNCVIVRTTNRLVRKKINIRQEAASKRFSSIIRRGKTRNETGRTVFPFNLSCCS